MGDHLLNIVTRARSSALATVTALCVIVPVILHGAPADRAGAGSARATIGGWDRAEQILVRRCMHSRGFQYHVEPSARPAPSSPRHPYGIDDVAWARAHGFGSEIEAATAHYEVHDPQWPPAAGRAPLQSAPLHRGVGRPLSRADAWGLAVGTRAWSSPA